MREGKKEKQGMKESELEWKEREGERKKLYMYIYISKFDDYSRGRTEGSFFNSYYPEVCRGGRYNFPSISSLYPWYVPYIVECSARQLLVPMSKRQVCLTIYVINLRNRRWMHSFPNGINARLDENSFTQDSNPGNRLHFLER